MSKCHLKVLLIILGINLSHSLGWQTDDIILICPRNQDLTCNIKPAFFPFWANFSSPKLNALGTLLGCVVNIFKWHLLWNCLTDWNQITCGVSWDVRTKVYSWCPVHMTKMAVKPIYGKNFWKSSQESISQWPWNFVSSIGGPCPIKFM